MSVRIIALAIASAFFAQASVARTVTIDFRGGAGVGYSDGRDGTGTWTENGFDVAWDVEDIFYDFDNPGVKGPVPSNYTGFTMLSDIGSDTDAGGRYLTFSRPDGRPFKVETITTSMSYEGNFVFPSFSDENGQFSPPFDDEAFPILRDALKLEFETKGGKQGTSTVATASAANNIPSRGRISEFFGPADMPVAEATGFRPLSQLTISVTDDREIDFESAALKSFREFAPQYLPYAELCGIGTGTCQVSGVGSFRFEIDYAGIRNDIAAVWIDSVTFKVGGAPAPVPLPASALALIAGLGLLGAAKLRRNA